MARASEPQQSEQSGGEPPVSAAVPTHEKPHHVGPIADVTDVTGASGASADADTPVVASPVPAFATDAEQRPFEPAHNHPGQLVTVFGAKGGSGKTTIATNLAAAIASAGATVCLVDLDLAFGDVAISLQLSPRRTMVDAVAFSTSVAANVDSLVTSFRPGFDCVLAPIEPGDSEKISPAVVGDVLDALRGKYEFVIVDTPSQLSEHVLTALDHSTYHLLVTNPEIPALKNLRLALDMLDLLNYDRAARGILLNRSDAKGAIRADEAESAIRSPIAVKVPASHEVPVSINRGVPIVEAEPDHSVSAAIRDFAEHVLIGVDANARQSRRGLRLRKRSG